MSGRGETGERYLWDPQDLPGAGGAGGAAGDRPDPEVERLERLLGRYRWRAPARPRWRESARSSSARWRWTLALAAALIALLALGVRVALREGGEAPESYLVEGIAGLERAGPGARIVTDERSTAIVRVAGLGEVAVRPSTRLAVEDTGERAHKLFLEEGTVRARILAEARRFQIGTPAGLTVDLGCEYEVTVDGAGRTHMVVHTGRVAFETAEREVIVPAGARCEALPGDGPNTPVRVDAFPEFVAAVRAVERSAEPDPAALERALACDPREESVTLWHLFTNAASDEVRRGALERLSRVHPLPDGTSAEDLLAGDASARAAWLEAVNREWDW